MKNNKSANLRYIRRFIWRIWRMWRIFGNYLSHSFRFPLTVLFGVKNGIHPERIYKLIRSTHIVPGELMKRGYAYQTDLEEGLRRWLQDDPQGEFI